MSDTWLERRMDRISDKTVFRLCYVIECVAFMTFIAALFVGLHFAQDLYNHLMGGT